jgi:hypothetical protein
MGYHHRRTISMSDEETRTQSLPGDKAMCRSRAMVLHAVVLLVSTLVQVNRASSQELSTRAPGSKAENQWRGVHIMSPGRDGLPLLKRAIAEKLAPMGVNTLIVIDELIDSFGADAFHDGIAAAITAVGAIIAMRRAAWWRTKTDVRALDRIGSGYILLI